MPDYKEEEHIVFVSRRGVEAYSEPKFLIKVGGVYYLTLGLWVYDPAKTEGDAELERGVAEVERLYAKLREVEHHGAVAIGQVADDANVAPIAKAAAPAERAGESVFY